MVNKFGGVSLALVLHKLDVRNMEWQSAHPFRQHETWDDRVDSDVRSLGLG